MKTAFIFLVVFATLSVSAQQNLNEDLRKKIDSLQSVLVEKNYARIPVGDLDRVLSLQVQSEVYNIFYKFLAVFGIIIFGGGFGLYRSLQSELKKQVSDVVDQKSIDLKTQLKDISEAQNRENSRQDVLIKTLTDSISSLLQKQDKFLAEATDNVNKKIADATGTIWNDIADNKIRSAKEVNHISGPLARELSEFLNNDSVKLKMEKKRTLIDDLMRCFYYTNEKDLKLNGFEGRNKEMISLLNKHEDIELLPPTYVNAAIALANNYEYHKSEADKKSCIECCDKALKVLNDYGIPFVLKLEVLAIDYINAYDKQERDSSLDQAKRILHVMNKSQSHDLHYESVQRIIIDKGTSFKPYLELLEKECANEILELKEKAVLSIITSPTWLKEEKHKNVLLTLLEEGYTASLIKDGVWKAVKLINAGVEATLDELEFEIEIKGYNYYMKEVNSNSSGYWYFLNSSTSGINFYSFNNNNYDVIKAISKIDSDSNLTLCINRKGDQRPIEFSSTILNQFTLVELVRV